ncbi:neurogenic locus notch homolog protein 2-like isoform X2 [Acanthaster planci]|nr:neurogenic locus notch homolog protein 2-like isoform X2 [Acanthaster planci]XP_022101265.1 neurogenic locus notch homolog protein 2-like isoform X2 [Acanthaster planci]
MEGRLRRNSMIEFCLLSCLIIVTTGQITPTASPTNTCASHPCENGGSCTAFPNAFICRCPEEYIGLRCETHSSQQGQTACISNPCVRGECVSTGLQQFTCMCPAQWRGSTCNIDVDECTSNPCRNGGTCQNLPGNYSCVCLTGYAGQNCEQDVTCPTNVCNNNGTCVVQNQQQVCICPVGFTGTTCQVTDVMCTTKVCSNNGTCVVQNQQQVCICPVGFTGPTCQVTESCSPNPCKNGHCVLSDEDPNGYVCHCHAGYTARLCDQVLHVACSHDGDTYYDGEVRNDRCNQCHCRGGEWLCTKKFCGSFSVMFDFIGDFSTIVQGQEDKFKSSLKTDLARVFSIQESMIANLMVSAGSIHVEFELVAVVDSHLNIEDVAAQMLAKLDSGTYYFRFEGTSLFVDVSSVQLEKVEPPTKDPSNPAISNVVLVVVCVLVSLFLIIAVIIGTVVIIVHRRRSEKTAMGQFRGRDQKEEYPMNNTNHMRHHNDLYSSVPNDSGSLASRGSGAGGNDLKDINIAMFAKVADPKDSKSGLDHV